MLQGITVAFTDAYTLRIPLGILGDAVGKGNPVEYTAGLPLENIEDMSELSLGIQLGLLLGTPWEYRWERCVSYQWEWR